MTAAPASDAAETTDPAAALPAWDLRDLYAAPDAPELQADLEWALSAAEAFRQRTAGQLKDRDGEGLGLAIAEYEAIVERLHKVMGYAQLRFAENMADPERGRFLQTMQERHNAISAKTLFFNLELNRIPEEVIEAQLAHPAAGRYARWVLDSRAFLPHQLSDEIEELLHDKSVTGANAWIRLFDQTIADIRFTIDGETLTLADTLNRFDNPDEAVRRTAAKALGEGLGEHIQLFSLITNTLAKDKEIEDKWRHYPHPVAHRNLANRVEDEVVEALVSAIKGSFGELAHRYYRMKAGWFGRDSLNYWDRNAPLPGDEGRTYTWAEAQDVVLRAFDRFDPRIAALAERFFAHRWIDAAPRPGKDPGAFSHAVAVSAHPFILMNFYGRPRDVTTLAHELGHGVHQVLAAEQGTLLSDTPLTLAESASVFGEMLVFRAVLAEENDPLRRRRLLAGKVENMLNTVVRQVAFFEFERQVHEARRAGELSAEQIGDLWLDIQRQSLGPVFRFDDEYRHYWAYIPHFIHTPFYVYAYAFGDCLVNSLYQVYSEGAPGFQDHYIDLLRAGGSRRHRELLQPFGLDASDPAFWRKGLQVIIDFMDELETLPCGQS